MNPSPGQRPTWVDAELFPFASRFVGLADHPVLLLWGDRDIAFRTSERDRFSSYFPAATTVHLRGAGHFIASDAPDEVVAAVRGWHPHTTTQARMQGGH